MAIGQNLSDFVGYSVGVSAAPADVGYVGFLDFVGCPVGVFVATPPTPTPEITVETRRWPGPPFILYQEGNIIPVWQRQRENEEIIIL